MESRVFAVLLLLGVLCAVQADKAADNNQIQVVDEDFIDLVRAKVLLERHVEKRGHQTSCRSNPCKNGAWCSHIPTEFQTRLGLDYRCLCQGDYSGFFCEIYQPCNTCPSGTRYCQRTTRDQTGRYCYDRNFTIVV